MKVTSLKRQIKNPDRISVFVDDKYSFSLSLSEVVKYRVANGKELTKADVKKYKKISEDGKLAARALEWVLNRPHSTREFSDYMRRKKAELEFTQRLVDEYTNKKYLDDETYARWLVELRGRSGKSNRALRSELYKKGVSREIIDAVLADSSDEVDRLRTLIAKKSRLSAYKDPVKLKKYLISQGFNYSLINHELDDAARADQVDS